MFTYILNVITILVEEDNPFSVDSFHAVSPWYLLLNFSNRFYTFSKIKSVGKYVIYVVGSFFSYYFFCLYARCKFCKFDLFIHWFSNIFLNLIKTFVLKLFTIMNKMLLQLFGLVHMYLYFQAFHFVLCCSVTYILYVASINITGPGM